MKLYLQKYRACEKKNALSYPMLYVKHESDDREYESEYCEGFISIALFKMLELPGKTDKKTP